MLLLLTLPACGTTGDPGGGASHLPVSGAGPFRPLDATSALSGAPIALIDATGDLDEPAVAIWGPLLALWVTTTRTATGTRIEHADALSDVGGFFGLGQAIDPDQLWEAGQVSSPSVLWDGGSEWALFYLGRGGIGWATSTDGHLWQKAPGPALIADTQEEGSLLSSPAAVRITDEAGDRVRVYYLGAGRLWAAEAPYADVRDGQPTGWTRLDGDPATPARDPMLDPRGLTLRSSASATLAVTSLAHVSARAGRTPAGRLRHDLYLSLLATEAGADPGAATVEHAIGFASSFSGFGFALAADPLLPLTEGALSAAETPYLDRALLVYVRQNGAHRVIAVAESP